MGFSAGLLKGAAAGAAGTTALNTVTYLDMALRGRPASSTPEETVRTLSEKTGIPIPGDSDSRSNRISGLAPLTGVGAGVGVGALLGLVRSFGLRPGPVAGAVLATLAAMVAGNAPLTALAVTDPRKWDVTAWLSDVVPHVAYGIVTSGVLAGLDAD